MNARYHLPILTGLRRASDRAQRVLLLGLLALGLLTQARAPQLAEAATWELLTPFPADDFDTRNLEQFASDVRQATAGALEIVVLPEPGDLDSEGIERAVSAGRAPAGSFLLSDLGNRNPAFQADTVPFLVTSYDEALALWEASRPVLEPMLNADGLHVAMVTARPPRGLFARNEIWTMEDFRGLRILDDSPMTRRFAILAQAVPTPMPQSMSAATLAGAFGGGIDAMIAALPVGVTGKAWTYAPYYYDLRMSLPKTVLVFNAQAYGALDEESRRALLNAAVEAQNRGWQASSAANNDAIDYLRAQKMTVAALEPEVAAGLAGIGETMAREWAERGGPQAEAILASYRVKGTPAQ